MKKYAVYFLLFCLFLTACGIQPPEKTADGSPWQSDWENVGSLLGVEPMSGWTVQRNEDVLAAEGTFYTVWTKGNSFTYVNAIGDDVTGYDGQIHLVAIETTPEEAKNNADMWEQLISDRYDGALKTSREYAGQTFLVSVYDFPTGDFTFHGASATAIRGNWAIHADVLTKEDNAQATLNDFWSHCHWAE